MARKTILNLLVEVVDHFKKDVREMLESIIEQKFKELVKPRITADSEILLTREEVADMFKISLVTLHSWSNSNMLKPYKIGVHTYFKKSEVDNALKAKKAG